MNMFSRGDKPAPEEAQPAEQTPQTMKTSIPPAADEGRSPHSGQREREDATPSIVSAGLHVQGNLESKGEIHIDGAVEGDVRAQLVKVGKDASIKGALIGEKVELAGSLNGSIEARTVTILKTAHVTGDIVHEALAVESGAYLDGHCRPGFGKGEPAKPQKASGQDGRMAAADPDKNTASSEKSYKSTP